jgi:hypothetical protein
MKAFHLKDGYSNGAGECVSLAALYAAAAFIICEIPLEDIYMILTPLHSQNFIDLDDGILTNNRRLVTKTMWFNGSEISNKAQRALRNENITIVAHNTGYIHCLYPDATMSKKAYEKFCSKLDAYLSMDLSLTVFANFLRSNHQYHKFFQICRDCHGQPQFLKAEVIFHYEHGSNFRVADDTFDKLLAEVSDEDFLPYQLPNRIRCDELSDFINQNKPDLKKSDDRAALRKFIEPVVPNAGQFVNELAEFLHAEAKLPSQDKNFLPTEPIEISNEQTREQIIEYLQAKRQVNSTADLAFYAYRDMDTCDWQPFVKAAFERNPVSTAMSKNMKIEDVYAWLSKIKNDSIYDGKRLAQPDEVANYATGDGLEKALFLANVIRERDSLQKVEITADNGDVILKAQSVYRFCSSKDLRREITLNAEGDSPVIE